MNSRLTIEPTQAAVALYVQTFNLCLKNCYVGPSKFVAFLEFKKTVLKKSLCYCYVLHPIIWCTVYTECHAAPKCPAPKRRSAKTALRQNGAEPKRRCAKTALLQNILRQNGCAKTVAPKRRRQTVTYTGSSATLTKNVDLNAAASSSDQFVSVVCYVNCRKLDLASN